MANQNILQVNDENFQSTISQGVTLVDFYADWCGPCKMIAPELEKLAQEMGDQVKVAKLNVEEAPGVTAQFGVTSIPTLIVFKDGQKVDSHQGLMRTEQLKQFVSKAL
ncbi:MAG: thioredoxin [Chlamydiales bacterium]|jgi:thioredoxin 1|nr:thioredoxin [Chlamydiales bacterium]